MTRSRFSPLALLVAATLATAGGCGGGSSSAPAPGKADKAKPAEADHGDHDHDHGAGPHGGVIIEFGKYHAEFTVSHPKKEVTVYILSGNLKRAVPIDSPSLTLSIKEPKFQVELKPSPLDGESKGQSSRFVGTDDRFGVEQDFGGTLSGVVGGKPYAGDFQEKDDDHAKKK